MSRANKAVRRADGGSAGPMPSAESRMKDSFRKMDDSFRALRAWDDRTRDKDQADTESEAGARKKLDPSSRRKTPL